MVEVSYCTSRPNDRKLSWWPRHPTLSSRSKVTRKVKFSTLSDFDGWGVILYVSAQRSKVVMVTLTSDPFFKVKGHQKGQIFNFVRFRRLRCQIVRLGPTIEICHGDPDVRPFLQGQRSPERPNFQLCPISTVEVSNCTSRPNDRNLSWWPRRPILSSRSKVTRKVKFSTLSDFDGWDVKLYVSAQRSKVVMVTPTSDLFFGVKGHQTGQIFNFVRFQRLRCQIVGLGLKIKSCHGDPTFDHFFGVKGHKKGQIFNFARFQWLRCQIVGLGPRIKVVMVTLTFNPFFRINGQQKGQIFKFRLKVSNCRSLAKDQKCVYVTSSSELALMS